MVATSAYSIVTIEFPHQREVYIGYCQTAVGLGLLLGPVIGTTIYRFAKYQLTFYILAVVLTCSLLAAIFLIPSRINRYSTDKPNEVILDQKGPDSRPSVQGPRPQGIAERYSVDMVKLAQTSERYSRRSHVMMAQVTFKIFFTNVRAMTAIISSMFAMIFMLFYEPVFTDYIAKEQKWVDEENVGYCLAIGCFTYAVASPLVGILCSKIARRYVTCFAFILCAISLFLLGPSKTLHFPENLGFSLAGIGCLGFSVAFLFVPLLPEIVAAVSEKEGLENSPFLSDKASGIYNSAYGIGNCLAPILGGAISSSYPDKITGFRMCCDIMGFCSLGFCGIYILFAIIPAYLDDKKRAMKREQKLIADLQPGAVDSSLTIEFENNRNQLGQGALNDSNRNSNAKK
jgi:MFS family permease